MPLFFKSISGSYPWGEILHFLVCTCLWLEKHWWGLPPRGGFILGNIIGEPPWLRPLCPPTPSSYPLLLVGGTALFSTGVRALLRVHFPKQR